MKPSEVHKTQLAATQRLNVDGEKLQKGLAKLVLILVELLRQLLEKQAERRVRSGSLSDEEVERLGLALMQVREKIREIAREFGVKPEELNIDLRPLLASKHDRAPHASLVDIIDRLLDKGTVLAGEITISVANIDLIVLDLLATLSSVHTLENIDRRNRLVNLNV